MYLVKTPLFIQKIYDSCTWRIDSHENAYLTFDDGPDPEATPWVLATLKSFGAKATFFCIGEKARDYPEIMKQILSDGHALGNHSYSHSSGWTTKTDNYLTDVAKCKELVDSKLFRPPYGRLKPSQLKALKSDYEIVMWDVMCGDFEARLTSDKCLTNITENAKAGSIILLHDTAASLDKLKFVLPRVLEHFGEIGLKCEPLQM